MKATITILIAILANSIFSQTISISGTVESKNDGPLPYANIIITKAADSSLVKATISKDDGNFSIQGLEQDKIVLTISSLGFKDFINNIELTSNLDLGTVSLEEALEELSEVNVIAEKPLVQVLADKTIFNVENTINATGTNGWELLRKAPGLIIDNTGNIILEGKSGVQIYIDGKPSVLRGNDLQAFLQSLQSTDIESIEIITQPSSKYDAGGNAGIINLKLKKDKNLGTNGSITTGITFGDYARPNSSLTLNNHSKTGNLYGTYSNGFGKNYNYLYLDRIQNGTRFDAKTNSVYETNNHNFRIGYDLYASTKSTFGAIVNGNFNDNTFRSNSRTPIFPVGSTQIDSILIANNVSKGKTSNFNANLNYRFADTLGHSLNIDADYGKYKNDGSQFQPNQYYSGDETVLLRERITRQETPIDIDIATFKTDYEQNFLKGTVGLGFKVSYVSTFNDFRFSNLINDEFINNENQSNQFEYNENINAAYFNFNRKWEKWNFQVGLRLENTHSEGNLTSALDNANDKVTRNYLDWFPSGGITYQLNQQNQFALNYSRRIERPNYSSLNPFEYKIDELSFRRGNPFLQPQYASNIKFSHTYNYTLNTSITYTYITDFFAQVTQAEGENRNFISLQNIANQEIWNLGISYPFKVNNWWNVYLSINAYTSSYQSTNENFIPITQETLSFFAQNTVKLPWKIRMEISGWYSSPSVWAGTYNTKSLGSLNVAFQRKFLSERLDAKISFNDILYTTPWQGTTQFGDLYIRGRGGNDTRTVSFGLTYNFGSNDIKKARSRETGLEDEKDRVGN